MTIATGNESSIAYLKYPTSYINGLGLSNDATTPNTKLDVAAGVTIDSTNTYQMISQSSIVIDATKNGLNGLDTGALAASTVYPVYLVSDPVTSNPIGAMISLSYTGPLMPFGYSAFKLLGYVTTDGSAHFLPALWTAGNSGSRTCRYISYIATAVTAGQSTTFAAVNLIAAVPNVDKTPVVIYSIYIPASATNVMTLIPGNQTAGTAIQVAGQVASVGIISLVTMMSQVISISSVLSPAIQYEVQNASDTAIIRVSGYNFEV
ncbi:MAG: hypothetical protein EPO02_12820 [Nitrospirae bacterium]|nr:MAG: hypothetical protein EPO02_12820 [Nitrospirota bacterium]